jgi:hypothetical protein
MATGKTGLRSLRLGALRYGSVCHNKDLFILCTEK